MLISFYKDNNLLTSFEPSIEEYPDKSLKLNVPYQLNIEDSDLTVNIASKTLDSKELLALPSIVYALHTAYSIECLNLFVTYLPNARQDRATGDSPCTLDHATAFILNSCNFQTITCLDVHSEAAKTFIPNLKVIPQVEVTKDYLEAQGILTDNLVAIVPDRGAMKYVEEYGLTNYVRLTKTRDPKTGFVSFAEAVEYSPSFNTNCGLVQQKAIMFDDIGASCITHKLAAGIVKKLGVSHVTLVLSHAFLTKGIEYLSPEIDKVLYVNDMVPLVELNKIPNKEGL